MKVKLKTISPDIEQNIVEIARVSSSRKDKSENPEGLINYLIRNKHWSPFEHGHITMEIETSKAIGIQLLRHRSFTFQELSQRYAVVGGQELMEVRLQASHNRQSSTEPIGDLRWDEEEGYYFYIEDDATKKQIEALNLTAQSYNLAERAYTAQVESGVARECARFVLPMATKTTIYMTGPIRSWIHLFDVRDDSHAQKEIQLIAKEMKKIFIEQCPLISVARKYI